MGVGERRGGRARETRAPAPTFLPCPLPPRPQYQNRRPEYLQNWWSVVNWDRANEVHAAAVDGKAMPL